VSAMDSSVYTKVDARCIPKSFELHREDADHQPSMPFMSNAIHARVHLLLLRPRKIGSAQDYDIEQPICVHLAPSSLILFFPVISPSFPFSQLLDQSRPPPDRLNPPAYIYDRRS